MSLKQSVNVFCDSPGAEEDDPLLTQNALGIELEYENVDLALHDVPVSKWSLDGDGSLRAGGIELVSRPLFFGDVEPAIIEAEAFVERTGAVATPRCGLHTHMNMVPYNVGQVWSLACLYALIEPTIFQTFAVGREDSIFAVPLWLNTSQTSALYSDICMLRSRPGSFGSSAAAATSKYAALNFNSLHKFGTLEMRQPYCTNNFEAIRIWLDFCKRLIERGVGFNDPDQVLDLYENEGLTRLQEELFGGRWLIHPDTQELAEDAAAMIAGYTEPTWQELRWDIQTEVA
jgi:hypothetical protein